MKYETYIQEVRKRLKEPEDLDFNMLLVLDAITIMEKDFRMDDSSNLGKFSAYVKLLLIDVFLEV